MTQPTAEQLALAWRHMARPGWPATLQDALQHHVYGTCIRALARQLGRARICTAAPHGRLGAAHPQRHPRWDARRAAANDLQDD